MSDREPCEEHVLVNRWLGELGLRTGLSLRLDADGVCGVGHSSGLDCAVEVPAGNGRVVLRIPLMGVPEASAPLLEHCLVANFLGLGPECATLAIDPVDRDLVLWALCSLDTLDADRFAAWLVSMFETAQATREDLERFNREPHGGVAPLDVGMALSSGA